MNRILVEKNTPHIARSTRNHKLFYVIITYHRKYVNGNRLLMIVAERRNHEYLKRLSHYVWRIRYCCCDRTITDGFVLQDRWDALEQKGTAVAAVWYLKEQYPAMTSFSPRNVRICEIWGIYTVVGQNCWAKRFTAECWRRADYA